MKTENIASLLYSSGIAGAVFSLIAMAVVGYSSAFRETIPPYVGFFSLIVGIAASLYYYRRGFHIRAYLGFVILSLCFLLSLCVPVITE